MGAVVGQGGPGGKPSQDFDLQLAPIIDAFTVLITFLLVSAGFLSIGFLDAGISAPSKEQTEAKPPSVQVSVKLLASRSIQVKVSGKQEQNFSLAKIAGDEGWNSEELTKTLTQLKTKWTDLNSVTLEAEDNVAYQDVVKSMDLIRKTLPAVLLGGF